MGSLVSLTKALLFASLTAMVCTFTYLVWMNPDANFPLEQERARILQEKANLESETSREWNYSEYSDVAAEDDTYPIVVLRTGFKVIRTASDRSLIGWKYEIMNTSPQTRYVPTVNYTLQDEDGFDIASGTSDGLVNPESYESITGTISIDNIDLERLYQSSWTISLSPSWQTSEAETENDRYTRLASLDSSEFPYWTREFVENGLLASISEKWIAVKSALEVAESLEDISDSVQ